LVLALLLIALLRLGLGAGLYWASPEPTSEGALYQVSHALLAPDAPRYHAAAELLVKYWRGDQPFFIPGLTPDYLGYPAILASLYYLVGSTIWAGLGLNAMSMFLASLMAFPLAARLGRGPAGATCAALLVALWPPSWAYTSVLLKDAPFLACLMGVMLLLVMTAQSRRGRDPWVAALLLAPLAWLAMTLRPDFMLLGLAAAEVAGVLGLAGAVIRRRPAIALGVVTACFAVGLAAWAVKTHPVGPYLYHEPPRASESAAPRTCSPPRQGNHFEVRAAAPASSYDAINQAALGLWRTLWAKRWLYAATGSASLSPDALLIVDDAVSSGIALAAALRDLLLFPYPWQRWPSGEGILSWVVTAQSLLWYALLPGLAWGLAESLRRRPKAALLLVFWLLGMGLVLALVMVNLGTLYRVRDMIFLPLLAAVSLRPYAPLWRWVRTGRWRRP
jgi:hypothetical protein